MGFKGTKGPWFNDDGIIEDKEGREVCYVYSILPTKKDLYNRQLISKSPEILEMLIDLTENYYISCQVKQNQVEQLIKQATEL